LIAKNKDYASAVSDEYSDLREKHAKRHDDKKYITLAEARENKIKVDWDAAQITTPKKLGVHVLKNFPLDELVKYIDWTPFFLTWELKGRYPEIFEKEGVGEEAKKLFDDAKKLLNKIVDEKILTANGVYGLFPANANSHDDIELYTDDSRAEILDVLHSIRQQQKKSKKNNNIALADFVAPKDSGKNDYVGAFAVTTGIGALDLVKIYESDHDDYNAIMVKALADRLAEAFAEMLHEKVRKEFWGYAPGEELSNNDLIKESYTGIRPAAGYPAQPDHTEKLTIFKLLNAEENTSICLTETLAMNPAASVSGIYIAHPDAKYFTTGKISKDQVQDYAARKIMSLEECEKWLAPVLNY
jgi:5-methyltetrahydrofolate--homocysteine methyltransferase